jgi:carboxymethylenebutenolidase
MPAMTNLTTATVTFKAGGRDASGFLASPAEGGPYPGVIVIQEWWGLNDHIKDIAQRAAREGFVALAVDLYDGQVAKEPRQAQALMTGLDKQDAVRKLSAGVDALNAHPKVAAGRVGVMGFCMGGFYSLLLASGNKEIRAAAPFYGHVPPDAVLEGLRAPTLYVYAGKDHIISTEEIDRLEDVLRKTGNPGTVLRYPEADHAFVNDTRKEVYKADDAKDAWTRAIAFLKRHAAV